MIYVAPRPTLNSSARLSIRVTEIPPITTIPPQLRTVPISSPIYYPRNARMTDAPGCKYTPGDGGDPVRYRPTFDPFTPLRAANTFREEGWPNVSTAEEREHLFPRDTLSRVTPPCLSPPPPHILPRLSSSLSVLHGISSGKRRKLRFGRDRLKKKGGAVCFDRGGMAKGNR